MFTKLFVAVLVFSFAGQVVAEDTPTMRLTGQATVSAEPDVAYISAAVISKNNHAGLALHENSASMKRIFEVLEKAGVERKEITTSQFSFNRTYRQVKVDEKNWKSVFDGYQVSNQIRVEVCDLESLGKIITSLVDVGVTNMGGVTFGSSQRTAKLDKARELAMQDALKKAKIYAQTGGFTLVKIANVSEQQNFAPRAGYSRMMAEGQRETPISGGSLSFSITVSVIWEIGSPVPSRRSPQ